MRILAGGVGQLAEITRPPYDLVLLLGVLMYLPASAPVIGEVSGLVGPGGVVSIATRTRTSALWRPAARQDWAGAAAAFAEDERAGQEGRDVRYVNEIGARARADDADALVATAAGHGLELERWYGVRTAVDPGEQDPPPPPDPSERAELLDVEQRLGERDPFRQLAQLAHFVFRRRGADAHTGAAS